MAIDPASIALIVGVGTLIVERLFTYLGKIRKSKCSNCCEVDIADDGTSAPINATVATVASPVNSK